MQTLTGINGEVSFEGKLVNDVKFVDDQVVAASTNVRYP